LKIGSHSLPRLAWTVIFLLYTSHCSCPPPHPEFLLLLLRWGLMNFSPRLALNHGPPDLGLPRNEDYRHKPLVPSKRLSFKIY
jgi:hypothetical protein